MVQPTQVSAQASPAERGPVYDVTSTEAGFIKSRLVRGVAIVGMSVTALVGGSVLAYGTDALGADGPAVAGAANSTRSAAGDASEAVPVTDQVLHTLDASNYNCGGHLQPVTPEGQYSAQYEVDYLNKHPELGKQLRKFHIDTLGQGAWDVLQSYGVKNANTPDGDHFSGTGDGNVDSQVDTLMHQRSRVALKESRTYANYTCVKPDGSFDVHRAGLKPTITISAGSHVDAVVLNDEGLVKFLASVKKNADGQVPVDVIDLGVRIVTVDGKETIEHESAVALWANGCGNPILKLTAPKPRTPGHKNTPTTTIPSKFDDGVLPGDGTPASQDHGTPDHAGHGPAGQVPDSSGHVPGETWPTVPTTRKTSPTTQPRTPATTGTQPVAPPTPPTTGEVPPNTGTTPPVPSV